MVANGKVTYLSPKLRAIGALGVAVLALSATACSSSGTTGKADTANAQNGGFGTLTINNSNFNTEWGLVAIAKTSDCFTKAGFSNVVLTDSGNSADDLISINAGRLDLSAGSFADVIGAEAKGLSNVVSIGTDFAGPASYLVVSNKFMSKISANEPIADRVKALKGATIAVTTPGGFNDLYATRLLESVGLSPETDATLDATGSQANELAALSAGRVDAIVETQPQVAEALQGKFGQILFQPSDYSLVDLKQGTINANKKEIAQDPAKYKAVGEALECAAQIVLNDPSKAKELARQYSGGATVSDAIWTDMWNQAVQPNVGGVWLAAKTNYVLSTVDIQKNIDFEGTKGVTPSQLYDSAPFTG